MSKPVLSFMTFLPIDHVIQNLSPLRTAASQNVVQMTGWAFFLKKVILPLRVRTTAYNQFPFQNTISKIKEAIEPAIE